jgi:transposase-like protein
MAQKPRIYYTDAHKALMWERWRQGESLQKIAQLFGRNHSSISRILAETGGIRPAPRCRSRLALTLGEREEISRAVVAGQSIRSIARSIGRAPSTVRSGATVERTVIEPPRPIRVLGIGHDVLRPVDWQRTGNWQTSWQASSNCSGRRSRSPDG